MNRTGFLLLDRTEDGSSRPHWASMQLHLPGVHLSLGVSECHRCSTIPRPQFPVVHPATLPHLVLFPPHIVDVAPPPLSTTLRSVLSSVHSKTPFSQVECQRNPRNLFPSSAQSEFSAQRMRQRNFNARNTFTSSSEPYSTLRKRIARRALMSERSISKATTSHYSHPQPNRRNSQSFQVTRFR